jgi:hypothetical protein
MALIKVDKPKLMDGDTKYSRSIKIPQYNPKDAKPHVDSLVNYDKYSKLLKHINESSVSEEEKKFLRLAASRHIVFNYANIADYYAHSDVEMQELMEESGLVIIDVDDAIRNGYVKLTERMKELIKESREVRGK